MEPANYPKGRKTESPAGIARLTQRVNLVILRTPSPRVLRGPSSPVFSLPVSCRSPGLGSPSQSADSSISAIKKCQRSPHQGHVRRQLRTVSDAVRLHAHPRLEMIFNRCSSNFHRQPTARDSLSKTERRTAYGVLRTGIASSGHFARCKTCSVELPRSPSRKS